MKITDVILEDTAELKKQIITKVKATDDEALLDRIYTVLNKGDLTNRIANVLTRDTDVAKFVKDIVQIIIDTPGTYEEKYAFIDGFPHGYIDIPKLLSGERVKLEELLTGGPFVHRVFYALKKVELGTSKGPGEFALAALSPQITIHGKGDLQIGKKMYELKASAGKDISSGGGRLGEPGLLAHDNVASIVSTALKVKDLSKLLPTGNLGLGGLIKITSKLDPAARTALGRKLFSYIFRNSVDVGPLVSALKTGNEAALKKAYIAANWQVYQEESRWDGVVLLNFALGEIQCYTDVNKLLDHIYNSNSYLISSDSTKSSRQILSQVTLKAVPEPAVVVPDFATGKAKGVKEKEVKAKMFGAVTQFVQQFVANRQNNTPAEINASIDSVLDMLEKNKTTTQIIAKLNKNHPKIKRDTKPKDPIGAYLAKQKAAAAAEKKPKKAAPTAAPTTPTNTAPVGGITLPTPPTVPGQAV